VNQRLELVDRRDERGTERGIPLLRSVVESAADAFDSSSEVGKGSKLRHRRRAAEGTSDTLQRARVGTGRARAE